jgi:hypothetical protein
MIMDNYGITPIDSKFGLSVMIPRRVSGVGLTS